MVLKWKGSWQNRRGPDSTGPRGAMAKRIAPCSWWRRSALPNSRLLIPGPDDEAASAGASDLPPIPRQTRSGRFTMRLVGVCTQDGPEKKIGERRFLLIGFVVLLNRVLRETSNTVTVAI